MSIVDTRQNPPVSGTDDELSIFRFRSLTIIPLAVHRHDECTADVPGANSDDAASAYRTETDFTNPAESDEITDPIQ